MPALTLGPWQAGMDRRQPRSQGAAGRFWELKNCYVTPGGTVKKRPGLVLDAALDSTSVGLFGLGGKLVSFAGTTPTPPASKYVYQALSSFGGKVYFAGMFGGYYLVQTSDYLHWTDTTPTLITDSNAPHEAMGVVVSSGKVFGAINDVVRFTATGNPRDWTTSSDAGFLPVGMNQRGAKVVSTIAPYGGKLAALFGDGIQVWQVDPNPANHALLETVDVGSGVPDTAALAGYREEPRFWLETVGPDIWYIGNDLKIHSANALRTGWGETTESDVGAPINSLIPTEMAAREYVNPDWRYRNPYLYYAKSMGQLWCVFLRKSPAQSVRTVALVYSFSATGKVNAWSRYEFPMELNYLAEHEGVLYARSGDNVYRFSETQYTDAGTAIPVAVEWGYLDAGTPGVLKQWMGQDVVIETGTAALTYRIDPGNTSTTTTTTTILSTPDTSPGVTLPLEACCVKLAPVITHSANQAFELNALTLYFNPLGVL